MEVLFWTALAKYFPPIVVILFLPILGMKKKITAALLQSGIRSGHISNIYENLTTFYQKHCLWETNILYNPQLWTFLNYLGNQLSANVCDVIVVKPEGKKKNLEENYPLYFFFLEQHPTCRLLLLICTVRIYVGFCVIVTTDLCSM